MRRTVLVLLALIPLVNLAQDRPKAKNYPSLLWEITGNGLKRPSYLFGTMHVSSKIAFHLADSFYVGIRNADVVALETNPESWQEDMSKYDVEINQPQAGRFANLNLAPNDYLTQNTLKFYKYDKKIERALYSSPSAINNLLYRSYGSETSDFEEDTYLDMYIYQCGKKWGKKVAGVEKYGESMKLMQEAYRDAAKDRFKRERNYDVDEDYSASKLQEAYRKGNLDLLDSINKLNSFSAAFDEKFLYKRNEIQAESIDSILRSRSTLFVGVGAAHLPGNRGVIELLRRKGYRLRPVKMGERDSRHKEDIEKVRVPVSFNTETAVDGLYKVDIPGRFYKFGEDGALDQHQYADMANGSYYMVTRIMTNAWMWGHTMEDVYKKIDSLLYENIPGKIISKTAITRNGYRGLDIINRTRRGDIQRYNIFITPFEILFFKMGGTGEYVRHGEEAKKFFGSIRLQDFKPTTEWKKFSPKYGGFQVEFPHEPYIGNDGSWIFDARDHSESTNYRVVRSDIHNYHFIEEDSFDLGLMEESFASSEFIDRQISRKPGKHQGYPSLDCIFKDKVGGIYLTRFIIQGPHYYALIASGEKETARMKDFLASFEIIPLQYKKETLKEDTLLHYQVHTPVFPEDKKEKLDIPKLNYYGNDSGGDEDNSIDNKEDGMYRTRIISNDTTGEKIFVTYYRAPKYYYSPDSTKNGMDMNSLMGDTSWIVRQVKKYELPGNLKVRELLLSDTGSSRMFFSKRFYRDGIGFSLLTQVDTLSPLSPFVSSFFESFVPVDSTKGVNIYARKSKVFFNDFLSIDSIRHKRALRHIGMIRLDSTDLSLLKNAITGLTFKEKNYLETKKALVEKLGNMHTRPASDYLKEIYYQAGDTIELQYAALETLLQQQTAYAFQVFRDIIVNEPPVLEKRQDGEWDYSSFLRNPSGFRRNYPYNDGDFLDELDDSLSLSYTILPELLPLLNLQDYKSSIMVLLSRMVETNLAGPSDYGIYFNKFLLEAKQEMKKQAIAEKRRAIAKAEESKSEKKSPMLEAIEKDRGNDDLGLYATLLLPFWETKPAVQPLIRQMLVSNDNKLKYNTLLLLLRNKKPVPDTLLPYFASLDEYRYELYYDLHQIDEGSQFPLRYNTAAELAKSSLLQTKAFDKPDTLVFISSLPAVLKGKKGHVNFYKYKLKKEDMSWKFATVGFIPERQAIPVNGVKKSFELVEEDDFTGFTDTKINEAQALDEQMKKQLRQLLYSTRKSAREFFGNNRANARIEATGTAD